MQYNKSTIVKPINQPNISNLINKEIETLLHSVNKEPNGMLPENKFINVYFPNWNNKPEPVPPVIMLGDTTILTHQNISSLIAPPGIGKSSVCEAVISSFINPDSDSLGFKVHKDCKGLVHIDNERTNTDVWNSFYRTSRRSGVENGSELKNVVIAGMRSVARLEERRKVITSILENNPCGLLIMDGAGDLVNDTNDLKEAKENTVWLRELTVRFDISIFLTLHPNPGTDKPRGHAGSEMCRESECILLAKSYDEHTKIITCDFAHGKNRNNRKLTTAYRWCDDKKMFVSAEYEEIGHLRKAKKSEGGIIELEKLATKIIPAPSSLKHAVLMRACMEADSCSDTTAKRKIKSMKDLGIITELGGFYRLNINNE